MAAFPYTRLVEHEDCFPCCHLQRKDTKRKYRQEVRHYRHSNSPIESAHRNVNCTAINKSIKAQKSRSESSVDDRESSDTISEDVESNDRDRRCGSKEKEHRRGRSERHSGTQRHHRARTESCAKAAARDSSFPVDSIIRTLFDTIAKRDINGMKLSFGIHSCDRKCPTRHSQHGHLTRACEPKMCCPGRRETRKRHSQSPRPRPRGHRADFEQDISRHEHKRAGYLKHLHHRPATSRDKNYYEDSELERIKRRIHFNTQLKDNNGHFPQTLIARHRLLQASKAAEINGKRLQRVDSDQKLSRQQSNQTNNTQHLQTGQLKGETLKSDQLLYSQLGNDPFRNGRLQYDPARKSCKTISQTHRGDQLINGPKQNDQSGNGQHPMDKLINSQPPADHLQKSQLRTKQLRTDQQQNGQLLNENIASELSDKREETLLKTDSATMTKLPMQHTDSCGDQAPSVLKNNASEGSDVSQDGQLVSKTPTRSTEASEPNIFLLETPPLSPRQEARAKKVKASKDTPRAVHSSCRQGGSLISPPPRVPVSPILRKATRKPQMDMSLPNSVVLPPDQAGREMKDGGDPQACKTRKRITFCDTPITIYPQSSPCFDISGAREVADGYEGSLTRSLDGDGHQVLDTRRCFAMENIEINSLSNDYKKDHKQKLPYTNSVSSPKSEVSQTKHSGLPNTMNGKVSADENPDIPKNTKLLRQADCHHCSQNVYTSRSSDLGCKQIRYLVEHSDTRKGSVKRQEESLRPLSEAKSVDFLTSKRRLPVETLPKEKSECGTKSVNPFYETPKEISKSVAYCLGEGPVAQEVFSGHQHYSSKGVFTKSVNEADNEIEIEKSDSYSLNEAFQAKSFVDSDALSCNNGYESVEAEMDMFYIKSIDNVFQSGYPGGEFSEIVAEKSASIEHVNTRAKSESRLCVLPPKTVLRNSPTENQTSYGQNFHYTLCGDILAMQNGTVPQRTNNRFYPQVKNVPSDGAGNTRDERKYWSPELQIPVEHQRTSQQPLGSRTLIPAKKPDISCDTHSGKAKRINGMYVDGMWLPDNVHSLRSFESNDLLYPNFIDYDCVRPPPPPYTDFDSNREDSSEKTDSQLSGLSHIRYTTKRHRDPQTLVDNPVDLPQMARPLPVGFSASRHMRDLPSRHRGSNFGEPRTHLSFRDINRFCVQSKRVTFASELSVEANHDPDEDSGVEAQKSSFSDVRASLECVTNARMMSLYSKDFGCVLTQKDIEFFDTFIRPIEMEYVSKMDPGKVALALTKKDTAQSIPKSFDERSGAARLEDTGDATEIDTFAECLYDESPTLKEKREKPVKSVLLEKHVDLTRNEDASKVHFWMRNGGSQTPASDPVVYEDEVYITVDSHRTGDSTVSKRNVCSNTTTWFSETSYVGDESNGVADDKLSDVSMKLFVPEMSKSEIGLIFQDKIESLSTKLVDAEAKLVKSHQGVESQLECISRKLFDPYVKADESFRGVEDKLEVMSRKLAQTEILLADSNKNVLNVLADLSKKLHEPEMKTCEASVGTDGGTSENLDRPGTSGPKIIGDDLESAEMQEELSVATTAGPDPTSYLALLCASTSGVMFGWILSLVRQCADGGPGSPLANVDCTIASMGSSLIEAGTIMNYMGEDVYCSDPKDTYNLF